MNKIATFIVNLTERTDRLQHIKAEFNNRVEFDIVLIEATAHRIGALGLFDSFKRCVKQAQEADLDFVVLCEDDHTFTDAYSCEKFYNYLLFGIANECDILLGGVSGFKNASPITANIFWLEYFSGTQFFVMYRRFYRQFLNIKLEDTENIDFVISQKANRIFAIYPQISYQKNFGYSDVTTKNYRFNVEEYFRITESRFSKTISVATYFRKQIKISSDLDLGNLSIPLYIINNNDHREAVSLIEQFKNRKEFQSPIGNKSFVQGDDLEYWRAIVEIVSLATRNDDDVIVICHTEHVFTKYYDNVSFIQAIVRAHFLRSKIVLGGIYGDFSNIIFVDNNLFWVDRYVGSQFLVIFRSFFETLLLNSSFSKTDTVDAKLSSLTSNKLVLYPMISLNKKIENHIQKLNGSFDFSILRYSESEAKLAKLCKRYNTIVKQ
ncbi:hypothetical protein [Parapedobacter indicus]|uniref:Glycosyltransferase involved in LPS biosynthesis, GR25 family n=1 Tax=Parapedobacter indicus TaxID=1477437 RepID=A0A1I3HSP0_9SPHI|nr:hypothetical protein [Parapedobacter indicus]PPL03154.1 hypothetical protein CLV26_103480 [Parapedobacter indicus]SFI38778.1 hypothetical protein SAMN05444682_103479 [Parapedobacter indicus]